MIHIDLYMMSSVVEYVWQDGSGEFRSKCRTLTLQAGLSCSLQADMLPQWNYDGSSTGEAEGHDSEILLVPIYVVPCPFRGKIKGSHFVALCTTQDRNGVPMQGSGKAYAWAKSVFNTNAAKTAKPWFGLEQEYFILDCYDVPLGLKQAVKQGQYYCSVGTGNANGRIISDQHYECCLGSGLQISGTNAEVAPGQWEFQIGPVEGLDAACQLLLARYFLVKLTEYHNLKVTFHPKPQVLIDDEELRVTEWNGSGCHTNFSTVDIRKEGGADHIKKAIKALEKNHDLHMQHYGQDNQLRMTGKCETASYSKFSCGRANRGSSVRIPNEVSKNKCGYFEDRRPASNCDPYLVTGLITATVLGLEDELQQLK